MVFTEAFPWKKEIVQHRTQQPALSAVEETLLRWEASSEQMRLG